MSCPAEFEFVEVFFVLLATLLTCSLVAAAEFSTLSQRRAAAQRRSCCQTQTETKSRKWADSEKRPLAWKVAVSNCGPAGKILEIVEKNVSENHNPLPQKHTSEVLLSKAAPSPSRVYDETRLWC